MDFSRVPCIPAPSRSPAVRLRISEFRHPSFGKPHALIRDGPHSRKRRTRRWPGSSAQVEFLNGAHARPKNPEVKATASLQSWWGQQIPFSTIVSSGALVKNADGTYSGSGGFTFSMSYSSKLSCLLIMLCRLDDCSDTPVGNPPALIEFADTILSTCTTPLRRL